MNYIIRFVFYLYILIGLQACQNLVKKSESNLSDEKVERVFDNPIINRNFPDPTVIKAENGYYYVYATNTRIDGELMNIQVLKSDNLLDWKDLSDALPEKPTWADKDFWAPHVTYNENTQKYYLFYSGESNDKNVGKCLGVAISNSPEGPFVDKGAPLLCGEGFKNIDPMVYKDKSGEYYLYWGSGFGSIKVQELSNDFLDFKKDSEAKELIFPVKGENPDNYEKLVEGAWLKKHDGFYYLYYSGDNCCGENAHYAVLVARSQRPTGPFEKFQNKDGKPLILSKNDRWLAPGHNSVVTDEEGQDWIMYHAIDRKNPERGRVFMMDRIDYKNGWPVINNGSPSNSKIN